MIRPFILIAEDDIDDRLLLKAAFDESKITIRLEFVGNGAELMEYLVQHEKDLPPRIILMDLNMPKKDGREGLKELKAHPEYKKIPVIIFTTTKNKAEIERCYELGANSYIVKPDSFESLRRIAENLVTYWFNTSEVA